MKIYSVENGYQKRLFNSFESANASFVDTARDIVRTYKEGCKDMGYLDLNMWIAVYDGDHEFDKISNSYRGPPEEYYVANMSNIREDGDIGPFVGWLHYWGPRHRPAKKI